MSPPKFLDPLMLTAALAVFLLAGWPMLGFAVAAAAWLAQRVAREMAARRVAAELVAGNRQRAMGITGATTLGRVWLMTLSVLLVGLLGNREDGLAAALMLTAFFTASFAAQGLAHLLGSDGEGAERANGAPAA
jgi:hypothetical protein